MLLPIRWRHDAGVRRVALATESGHFCEKISIACQDRGAGLEITLRRGMKQPDRKGLLFVRHSEQRSRKSVGVHRVSAQSVETDHFRKQVEEVVPRGRGRHPHREELTLLLRERGQVRRISNLEPK